MRARRAGPWGRPRGKSGKAQKKPARRSATKRRKPARRWAVRPRKAPRNSSARSRARNKLFAPSDTRQDAQVRADALDLANLQCRGLRQIGQLPQMEHAPARIADDTRREVDEQLVYHACLEQRAVQLRSRLHVNLVEFPPRELLHQLEQLDLAGVVRDDRDFGSRPFQRCGPLRIGHRADDERLPFLEEARGRRRLEFRIYDDLERLPGRIDAAHGELRVVVPNRAETRENRASASAPAMPVGPRRLARDPLAFSVRERSAAVQARRDFHAHPGPSASHARKETDVELTRLFFSQPVLNRDSRGAQFREADSRDLRIRILNCRHHAPDTAIDDRVRAGRSAEQALVESYSAYLAANQSAKPDICSARNVTL